MIKYVVTWVLTTYFSVPCDFNPPKQDGYGRLPDFNMIPAMACMESKSDTLKKEFTDRKSAILFIEKGQGNNIVFGLSGELSNFKLDSIKIKN